MERGKRRGRLTGWWEVVLEVLGGARTIFSSRRNKGENVQIGLFVYGSCTGLHGPCALERSCACMWLGACPSASQSSSPSQFAEFLSFGTTNLFFNFQSSKCRSKPFKLISILKCAWRLNFTFF